MQSTAVIMGRVPLVEEMGAGDLGDPRLNARRDRVLTVLEQSPDAAFPSACADDAEIEGLYRFLRNPRVSWEALIEPHFRATQARCAALTEVLVLHDTTDMVFAGEGVRTGLVPLGTRRHGFWLHTALAVSAEGLRAPLGLLALQPFVRSVRAPQTPKPSKVQRWTDPTKESRCWADGLTAVRTRLGAAATPIHVMDRAGDSYELLANLVTHQDRFVVRLAHDRQIETDRGLGALSTLPRVPLGERQVTLGPRYAGDRPRRMQRAYPPRGGRVATLRVAARRVEIQRPRYCPATLPPSLALHVVAVWEATPPAGESPVEWQLITTDPIATLPDVLRVVDIYRTRWVIEEFFKALKTGCAYEQRQLESFQTLLAALALLAPVAWQLLLLRHLAHTAPEGPPTAVLTAQQLDVLRASRPGARLGPAPGVRAVMLAIAALGGHLTNNGNPGWLVLGRGMEKLALMEAGWVAAQYPRGCDQS